MRLNHQENDNKIIHFKVLDIRTSWNLCSYKFLTSRVFATRHFSQPAQVEAEVLKQAGTVKNNTLCKHNVSQMESEQLTTVTAFEVLYKVSCHTLYTLNSNLCSHSASIFKFPDSDVTCLICVSEQNEDKEISCFIYAVRKHTIARE